MIQERSIRRMHGENPVVPGRTVAVAGAGKSGAAALRLIARLGGVPRLVERNAEHVTPELAAFLEEHGGSVMTGPHTAAQFAGADLIVPSPGVPLAAILPLAQEAGNIPVMAEMELAWRFTDEPVIAVTGTSGKTTTVTLIAAMLRAAGKKVFLGGNIGTPLSEYVLAVADGGEKSDVLVLETSSFQLQGCSTFHPRVAVLMNLSPNHLDQHADMEEYRSAKGAVFQCQTADDTAIFGPGLDEEIRRYAPRARVVRFSATNRFPDAKLLGAHNRANMEAAFQAASVLGVTEAEAAQGAAAVYPLAHRLEPVGEWDGILYINDSKATTPDALAVALESMDRPVRLLAGGVFKGGDLTRLVPVIREKVRAIGLFGANREVFENAWKDAAPVTWSPDLETAVRGLRENAAHGDVILLSPACSSFDQYANYVRRGEDFRRLAELIR